MSPETCISFTNRQQIGWGGIAAKDATIIIARFQRHSYSAAILNMSLFALQRLGLDMMKISNTQNNVLTKLMAGYSLRYHPDWSCALLTIPNGSTVKVRTQTLTSLAFHNLIECAHTDIEATSEFFLTAAGRALFDTE